jgi:hypothetical protein
LPGTRRLFRVVKSDPPSLHDFLPQMEAQPNRLPPADATAAEMRLQRAVSLWTTLSAALELAHRFPRMGGFIAELVIPSEPS